MVSSLLCAGVVLAVWLVGGGFLHPAGHWWHTWRAPTYHPRVPEQALPGAWLQGGDREQELHTVRACTRVPNPGQAKAPVRCNSEKAHGSCLRCEGGPATWCWTRLTTMVSNYPGEGPHRKRAFQRALMRARQHGGTWYKGQWMTSLVMEDIKTNQTWTPPQRNQHPRGSRLKIFSWNVRKLTTELWEELQTYVGLHGFDLVMLQSTGWSFSTTWTARGYSIIHSGDQEHSSGGLLMMIKTALGGPDQLSYSEVIAGRVLHVRVQAMKQHYDFINVYQHPWRAGLSTEQNLETRQVVWDALHECLSHLPFRNRLAVAGDFNASLLNDMYHDCKSFRQIVNHHHLGSLLQSQKHCPTYFSQQGNSQIDYLFGRQCQLDSFAKKGTVDHSSPLASWRVEKPWITSHSWGTCLTPGSHGAGNLSPFVLLGG